MIVQIPEYEYLWARQEARRRLREGNEQGHRLLEPDDTPLEHEVLTMLGELGAALAVGIAYEQIPDNDYGPDLFLPDGRSIEVKSVITPKGSFENNYPHFILPAGRELSTDLGILVIPRRSLQTVRVIGYCTQAIWYKYRRWADWLKEPNFSLAYNFLEKDLTSLRKLEQAAEIF